MESLRRYRRLNRSAHGIYLSPYVMRVAIALCGTQRSVAQIWDRIGGSNAPVTTDLKRMERAGLITRDRSAYALTSRGRFYTKGLVGVVQAVAQLNRDEILDDHEEISREDPTDPLESYTQNRHDIHQMFSSEEIIPALLALGMGRQSIHGIAATAVLQNEETDRAIGFLVRLGAVDPAPPHLRLTPQGAFLTRSLTRFLLVLEKVAVEAGTG